VIDRKYIRKRLNYIRNAQAEHKESLITIASAYMTCADTNETCKELVDAVMIAAQTLDIFLDLLNKILEKV